MPILDPNPLIENDKTYTPMEKRRREEMRLRTVRYGFFRVAKEPVKPIICSICNCEINGHSTRVNGTHYCDSCYSKR